MNNFKGTSGPWKVQIKRVTSLISWTALDESDGRAIAEVRNEEINYSPNAKAIAAVPDMVEALQAFLDWAEKQAIWDKTDTPYYKAKAALSKALD